jgi:hypothetical protein
MAKGPKARGSSRARDQLLIELHRLTGCGGDIIAHQLYNSGFGTDEDEPGDRDSLKAITGGGRHRKRERDALLIHYVEIAWADQVDKAGVALFFHPRSKALQVRYRKLGHRLLPAPFIDRHLPVILKALPATAADDVRLINVRRTRNLGSIQHPVSGKCVLLESDSGSGAAPYAPIEACELPGPDSARLFTDLANNWNTYGWQPFDVERTKPSRPRKPPVSRLGGPGNYKRMAKLLTSKVPKA